MRKSLSVIAVSVMASIVLAGCAQTPASGGAAAAPPAAPAPAAPTSPPAPIPEVEAPNYLPGDIHVIVREDGSGTRGAFLEMFNLVQDGQDLTYIGASISNSAGAIMTNVVNDVQAIGYISLGSLNDIVKPLSIDGVAATTDNIRDGSYTVARPFNLAFSSEVNELAQDFLDFIMSEQGQDVINGRGFVGTIDNAPVYASSGLSGTVTVGGSTSVAPLMERLKEAYEVYNSDIFIEIMIMGTGAGMTGAIEGTLDIGMASRPLSASELEELEYLQMALDGIIIIVNNANPLDDISFEMVREIYMGEVWRWADIN